MCAICFTRRSTLFALAGGFPSIAVERVAQGELETPFCNDISRDLNISRATLYRYLRRKQHLCGRGGCGDGSPVPPTPR